MKELLIVFVVALIGILVSAPVVAYKKELAFYEAEILATRNTLPPEVSSLVPER